MASIRTRVTVDDEPIQRYGFMEPAITLDPGRVLSATVIDCPPARPWLARPALGRSSAGTEWISCA